MRRPKDQARGGFALIVVVLVLAALLMLCTPFLLTARNSDQASQQLFSRAQADVALENALVHSRAVLRDSHFSLDGTPYFDDAGEVKVDSIFPEDFLQPRDTGGLMWDVVAADVAGRIDLNSAPPQVLAAMMGSVTRLVRPITADDSEIPVASTAGLLPQGYIWLGGELIHYDKIEGNLLTGLRRGLGVKYDLDDKPLPGPRPAGDHGVGANVVDQQAFAPVEWRLHQGDVRGFDSYERLTEANPYVLESAGMERERLAKLQRLGSVHGGVAAGPRWQRAARMISGGEREVSGSIRVDSVRWFNPGATIQISDGTSTELAVVERVNGNGVVVLDRGLTSDYVPYSAEVRVLNRRPVNVNTASAEVLEVLLTNLKLQGRNQRVTGSEARELAQLIVESRPFEGLEDLLRYVLLPAAGIEELPNTAPVVPDALAGDGAALIDPWDAVAIYINALNANDFSLEYSTMPFSFTSNNVFDLTLRATVNAPSGIERYSTVRERTELIVPQEELFYAWARQEDFDSLLRLSREAPYWATGPNATTRFDPAGSTPPTRMWAHMGTYEGQLYLPGVVGPTFNDTENTPTPEHVFANRDPDERGFAQLQPIRVDDRADPELSGRVLHFDHETRDPEGRYLPDQTIVYAPENQRVQWGTGTGLLRGVEFSMWVKPRTHTDAVLLDVGGSSPDADRLSVLFENGDLVLRVLDGGGDHRMTPGFREAAEVRYTLAAGDGPGLPIDVWHHIAIDVRGTRPSQMSMLVNGLAHGVRTPGLTRLTGQLDETTTIIAVESTEGFPDRGVVRIGNELIEYTKSGNVLDATFQATGPDAGFGGRNARVQWSGGETSVPLNVANTAFNHPQGAPVELYGFAEPLAADVTAGQGALPSELGIFRVACVAALEGGSPVGQTISVNGILGPFIIGTGINSDATDVTGLVLTSADDPDGVQGGDPSEVMKAFNPGGGYAALMQVGAGEDLNSAPIGGFEVVRYSGYDGSVLRIASWGDAVPELTALAEGAADPDIAAGGRRSFVVRWQALAGGVPIQDMLGARLFVMPISIPATGGGQAFFSGTIQERQFAQITEASAGELTEWVCYNTYVQANSQLVRDDPLAIMEARNYATGFRPDVDPDDPTQGGGGGPGGGGGGGSLPGSATGGSAPPDTPGALMLSSSAGPGASSSAVQQTSAGFTWEPTLGAPEDEDFPLSRAVREVFQHRGVMGTFPHPHASGTPVLPVFRARNGGVDGGKPGKNDAVFLMGADFGHIGWPVTVFRSHRPSPQALVHPWQQAADTPVAQSTSQTAAIQNVGAERNDWYFALDAGSPAPVQAGTVDSTGQAQITDTRAIARVLRFPSGERPRNVTEVRLGGSVAGSGVIPSAIVDEVVFGATDFGTQTPLQDPESVQAGQLVLREDCYDGDPLLTVYPTNLRIPLGVIGSTYEYLSALDEDGGLLRVGDELIAYESYDADTGELTIAQNGRGLLGTRPGNYEVGTPVTYLDGYRVSTLSGGMSATSNAIPVTSTARFPAEGTVLIDNELVHYTRITANGLEMPAGSTEPGAMDRNGPGLFRGRFGTFPETHTAGAPVILFPARYWDRWTERADAPELSYFGFELSQPAAFWREFFYEDEQPGLNGVQMGVLMRSDPSVPWDADPDETPGLEVFYRSEIAGGALPIGVQSDTVQWRVFVDYSQGAFDLQQGLGHGWRATPRLRGLATTYVAPSMSLRSVEK